jgi:ABC-type sugar transport system permease subunit
MKSKLFVLIAFIVITLIFCTISSFASYNFLSPESNIYLEELKERFREKEIILEKEGKIVWIVKLPKNDGVEIKKIKELVYNDETGKPEGMHNFTYITIMNPKGWTSVIWGSAADAYLYDVPKLCFVFDS